MKNNALRFGLIAAIALVVIASGYYWHTQRTSAAQACTASVSWDKSTINQGDSATETWTITGAAKASASCTDYTFTGVNSTITDNLPFGPQSYTFSNIQKSITCSVWGITSDGNICVSGPQTVTVSASGAGVTTGTTNPNPTINAPGSACPNLFWHSENSPSAWHFSFSQNQDLSSDPSYDWNWGALEEYWQSDGVSMTALDPLPPGLRLNSHVVRYPDVNMNNDGLNTDDYVNKDIKVGFPPITRYALAGQPTQQGTWTVRFKAEKSSSCSRTSTFEIKVTQPEAPPPAPALPPAIPTASASTNGLISFVKTIFYADPPPDGAQTLGDMTAWGKNGDKFLISGEYGGSLQAVGLNGRSMNGGGGLWTIAQDGSRVVERQAAIDAGSGTNVIYQHGHRHASAAIGLEWAKGGFVMENGSWGSCLSGGTTGYCTDYGAGANQAIYYSAGGDGYPVVSGRSGKTQDNPTGLLALKNKLISISTGSLYTLPRFSDQGPAGYSADMGGVTFGDNIINNKGEVFSVAADGSNIEDTGNSILDAGYTWMNYGFDWSQGFPPKLAVWEIKMDANLKWLDAKIKILKLASDGSVAVDRTIPAPLDPGAVNGTAFSFAIWSNYIVTGGGGELNPATGFISGKIYVWKGDQLIDTVVLPLGGIGYAQKAFAISKGGYVLINASWQAPRQDLVYLYKLNLKPDTTTTGTTPTPTPPPTGGGGDNPYNLPPAPSSTDKCFEQFRNYCDTVRQMQKQICALAPSSDFCKPENLY